MLVRSDMEYVVVTCKCALPSISRYLVKSATLKTLPCSLCVRHGLSSLIAGDTLCQQLVVRTATFKALPTCETY